MTRRTATILLVAIVVLGGIVIYLNANPELTAAPTPTPVTQSDTLWEVDLSQVVGLTVTDLEKQAAFSTALDDAGLWQVTQPQAGEADSARMMTIANTLGSLFVTREITDVANLADFGLEAPKYTIEIKLRDGTALKATVGEKAIGGLGYYVLREGERQPVIVGTASLDTLLTLPDQPPIVTPTPVATPEPLDLLPTVPVTETSSP